jgi:hypothetical protein
MQTETITTCEQLAELGYRIDCKFIPFSQSRSKKNSEKNLNYLITLYWKDRIIGEFDYSMGQGHCMAYNKPPIFPSGNIDKYGQRQVIDYECENGIRGFWCNSWVGKWGASGKKYPILPKLSDVINCLMVDSEVLDYPSFDDWANCFGYNTDSISAKKIYDACMSTALKLRAIPHEIITQTKEILTDY